MQDYDEKDPKSHEGLDLNKVTAREIISYVHTKFSSFSSYFIIVSCVHAFHFSVFFVPSIGSTVLKMIQSTSLVMP